MLSPPTLPPLLSLACLLGGSLLLLLSCSPAEGFPSGAPNFACRSMRPNHPAVPQPPETFPVHIALTPDRALPGDTVDVHVSVKDPTDRMQGLLVTARSSLTPDTPETGFSTDNTTHFRLLNCTGSAGRTHNALTHRTRLATDRVSLKWTVPADARLGMTYQLRFTIVRSTYVYWVGMNTTFTVGVPRQPITARPEVTTKSNTAPSNPTGHPVRATTKTPLNAGSEAGSSTPRQTGGQQQQQQQGTGQSPHNGQQPGPIQQTGQDTGSPQQTGSLNQNSQQHSRSSQQSAPGRLFRSGPRPQSSAAPLGHEQERTPASSRGQDQGQARGGTSRTPPGLQVNPGRGFAPSPEAGSSSFSAQGNSVSGGGVADPPVQRTNTVVPDGQTREVRVFGSAGASSETSSSSSGGGSGGGSGMSAWLAGWFGR